MHLRPISPALLAFIFFVTLVHCVAAQTFKVATYNVENYLHVAAGGRPEKSAESKAKVREIIKGLNADVLALQEMGSTNALLELRASLKNEGLDYPHWEHVGGFDTNIFVAVLSKYPFNAKRSHTNDNFLLSGRRFRVSRGFAEVDVKINENYSFTLLTAHLKSKRQISEADEAELRFEEAKILREKVDTRLAKNPNANIVVLGDLNDTKDSKAIKAVIGKGSTKLIDTRPAERNGDNAPADKPWFDPRNVTWTHYFGKEDTYSRIDYIMISPSMAREWVKNESYIFTAPNWGVASDHRPVLATFTAQEK